jgi:hypothetical protein
MKKQCWQVKMCGREPGGKKVEELGVCKASLPSEYNGINEGEVGGRFCWAIAGTLCGGEPQGEYSKKIHNCLSCEFLQLVEEEEGNRFILTPQHAILILETKKLKKLKGLKGLKGVKKLEKMK